MNINGMLAISRSQIAGVLVLGISLALSACGGGSGGGSAPANVAPNAGGAAAKGIVKNGVVTANELDVAGAVLRAVGNATTDSNGEYQITIGNTYAGGPIAFNLTAGATTVMVCDVSPDCGTNADNPATVNFGGDLNVPTLSMEALVGKANSGDVLSVNITPFTTMAAARARQAATLNAAAINSANSAVSNLLGGLDVLSLKPVNLADAGAKGLASPEQITYAAMSAAVGKLAISGGEIDLNAALNKLRGSFETGSINAETGTGSAFSLKDIVDAASNQIGLQGLVDATGVVTAMQQRIATAGSSPITPEPNANAGSPDIVKAKALVQDIRTWGVTLKNLNGPANAFAEQLDMAKTVSGPMLASASRSLGTALDILSEFIDGESGSFPYSANDFGAEGTGTVTVTVSGNTRTLNISGTIGSDTVNLTATLPNLGSATSISTLTMGVIGSVTSTGADPGASLTLTNGTSVTANFNPALVPSATLSSDTVTSSLSTGSFDIKATLAQTNTTNPVTFTGSIGMGVQRVTSGTGPQMQVDFNPTQASFIGTLSKGADSFPATITATISNADTYDPFVPDSETNFPEGTLSMSIAAKLAGQPEATLTLTGEITGFNTQVDDFLGEVTVILALSGGSTTTVKVKQLGANPANGTLEFRNTSGASMTVAATDGDTTGTLKVGTTEVGIASQSGDLIKITYNDGTFETLN